MGWNVHSQSLRPNGKLTRRAWTSAFSPRATFGVILELGADALFNYACTNPGDNEGIHNTLFDDSSSNFYCLIIRVPL